MNLWRTPLLVLRFLRLRPFDQSTEAGRADERHRLVALSASAAVASKLIGLMATLLTIPLALTYLGVERFGLWSTLVSLVATLQFADLGIGNGVINAVSEAYGRGDRQAVRRYVSSGFTAAGLIAAVLLLLLFPVLLLPEVWVDVFKLVDPVAREEVGPAIAVFLACISLAIPIGIVHRVQLGLQLGFIANLWQCVANLLGLLCIWLATQMELGMPWLVVALLGAPVLVGSINAIVFFRVQAPDLRPALSSVTRTAVRKLMSTGAEFLLLQIAVAIVLTADSVIIASVLGAAEVTSFAVPEKLFSIVTLLLATALSPLWPAYREALARGDHDWAVRTLRRSMLTAMLLSALMAFCLVMIGPKLIAWWVGKDFVVNHTLLQALALWKVLEAVGFALSMFLNGAGLIRQQVISAGAMIALTLVLKPWMVLQLGSPGAPLATTLIYVSVTLLPLGFLVWRMLRRWRDVRLSSGTGSSALQVW